MPRHSRSPSSSRSKKTKKSRSRNRSSERRGKNRYDDYDRGSSWRRDRSRDRERSRDRHKRKDRDRSRKRKKHSRDRHRKRSSSSSDTSQSRSSSIKIKSRERSRDRSRSGSKAEVRPTFVQERFNFSEAVSVLDRGKDAIDEINASEFVPKTFSSSATVSTSKKLPEKVKIDLKNQTILLPKLDEEPPEDTLINPKFFGDEDERMRRWIRKLYQYRQRKLNSV